MYGHGSNYSGIARLGIKAGGASDQLSNGRSPTSISRSSHYFSGVLFTSIVLFLLLVARVESRVVQQGACLRP